MRLVQASTLIQHIFGVVVLEGSDLRCLCETLYLNKTLIVVVLFEPSVPSMSLTFRWSSIGR